MIQSSIPPREPVHARPAHPPMIYIKQPLRWEYRQVERNLENEAPLNEAELNALGAEGWELTAVLYRESVAIFYFKRTVEK